MADDRELLRRYHDEGDLEARDQLVARTMPLVRLLAHRYASRGEPLDDLVQIGAIGLIKAIDRFELGRGVELTTYATPTIIGEIKRHFRDRGGIVRIPRALQELNARLARLVEELTGQLQRSPTVIELATAAGTDPEHVLEALEAFRAALPRSLSQVTVADDGEELDPLELLGNTDPGYELSDDRAVLAPGLRVLDEREQLIVRLRFCDGLTQLQIAGQLGISQMHVSRLLRHALEKVQRKLASDAAVGGGVGASGFSNAGL